MHGTSICTGKRTCACTPQTNKTQATAVCGNQMTSTTSDVEQMGAVCSRSRSVFEIFTWIYGQINALVERPASDGKLDGSGSATNSTCGASFKTTEGIGRVCIAATVGALKSPPHTVPCCPLACAVWWWRSVGMLGCVWSPALTPPPRIPPAPRPPPPSQPAPMPVLYSPRT